MPTTEIPLRNTRNGSIFRIYTKGAEIVSDPVTWSETHISSSGGGGYVHPTYGGHVSGPSVSSRSVEREKYFVKMDDGKELELRDAVPGRKGHNIILVYGGIDGQPNYLLATYNSETSMYVPEKRRYHGRYFTISGSIPFFGAIKEIPFLGAIKKKSKAAKYVLNYVILVVAITIVRYIVPHQFYIPIFLIVFFIFIPLLVVFGFLEHRKRLKAINDKLLSFLNSL